MKNDHSSGIIPSSLQPYFQEYSFAELTLADHADLVIERTLNYGNLAELRWLFGHYGWQRITEWVAARGAKRLSRRRYRLWCVLLDVSPDTTGLAQQSSIWPH
jgi:hypothetical protein